MDPDFDLFGLVDSGSCPSNFEDAMESEHCTQPGCNQSFRTLNTRIQSCPKREWEIVVKGASCSGQNMRFNRKIPLIDNLSELPLAKKALLQKAEIVAVVMYTGPVVF